MKIILSMILIVFFTSCKEEVKTDKEVKNSDSTAVKPSINTDKIESSIAETTKEVENTAKELTGKVETVTAEATTKVEAVKEQADAAVKAIDAVKSGNYEVACGKCVFKDAECKSCAVYIKFAGKLYPVSGLDLDAAKLGLCKTSATADVKGEVKDDSFSLNSLDNLKLNIPEIPATTDDALDKIKKIGF